MSTFLTYTVVGLVIGCIYALTSAGLVVTYTTTGIFNFGHGAVGMVAAFSYWQLTVGWGWPAVPSLIIVVLIGAPLFGAVLERVLMRRLEGAAIELQIVVTVGLLVFLIGVANLAWNPTKATRTLPRFFAGHKFRLFSVYVDLHEVIVVAVAVLVAVGLRLLFTRTRTGIAMRAVVDNPGLAAMAGARPYRVAQLSWALGAALAAVGGVLLAPLQYLDINLLTLAVINAIAAAVVGRLRSLPLTVIGGLVIGLAVTYAVGYLPVGGFLSKIQTAIPMVILFIAVVLLREERLRSGRVMGMTMPRVPTLGQSLVAGAVFIVLAVVASHLLGGTNLNTGTRGLVLSLALLSLVLLTGYAGQVSLCLMTFVGVGAFAMGHVGGRSGSLLGILVAVLLPAAFGTVVGAFTVRLRGLYLPLATLAFAYAMDTIFFGQTFGAYGAGLSVARVHIPGVPTGTDREFFVLCAAVLALASVGVLAIRRGRYGRRLAALNDAPAACATLGANISYTKLAVFAVSAGLAGLAGALYGGQQHLVTPDDFQTFISLIMLLLLLVGGKNRVSGAFLGAMAYAMFPILQQHVPSLSNIQYLLVGAGALTLGLNPDGMAGQLAAARERLRAGRRRPAESGGPDAGPLPRTRTAASAPQNTESGLVGAGA